MISNIVQPVEFLRAWEEFWADTEEKQEEEESGSTKGIHSIGSVSSRQRRL